MYSVANFRNAEEERNTLGEPDGMFTEFVGWLIFFFFLGEVETPLKIHK